MFGRRVFKVLLGTIGTAGATTGALYVTRPDLLVAAAVHAQRYQVGFRTKTVVFEDGFVMHYAEKGEPQPGRPSVIMLHGFSGNLDAAVPVVKQLSPDVHVVAIDAPGHGKTRQANDNDLHPKVMADRLKQFLRVTSRDEDNFHVVGWAMGGTVAGFFTACYPANVSLLTLIAPGMYTPVLTKPYEETINGDTNVLLPVTETQRKRFWRVVKYKDADLPKPVLDYVENSKAKRRECHLKVMQAMIVDAMGSADNDFIADVSRITTPTQVIWGENDGLLDISGADLLATTIGSSVKRKDIVPEAGHAFYAEEPHTLAALITSFQSDYRIHGKKWANKGEAKSQ